MVLLQLGNFSCQVFKELIGVLAHIIKENDCILKIDIACAEPSKIGHHFRKEMASKIEVIKK